jgi:putative NIF3 family GTP cyclohydrolase 1 type 2
VEEIRLEMVCPKHSLDQVLKALWASHPYEEVAYDLYPLSGYLPETRYLWSGELKQAMPLRDFTQVVLRELGDGIAPVKFAGDPDRIVKRVAWCSGGGRTLIPHLNHHQIDAYLTGDTGHHDALDCLSQGIALIDLDHYFTERLFIPQLRRYLEAHLETGSVRISEDPSGAVFRGM